MKTVILKKTKVSKNYQVVIPAEIRKHLNIKPGDEILWTIIENKLRVKVFSKRKEALVDLIGKLDMGKTDTTRDIDEIVSK